MSPPLVSWMVVAVTLIVVEALVVCLLRRVPPEISLRVVYLVGVLVVSSVWGWRWAWRPRDRGELR